MIGLMCVGLWLMLLQTGGQADWIELVQNEDGAFSYDPSLVKKTSEPKNQ